MTTIEDEIYEVWKELSPSDAYLHGLQEFAGKLFVPTPENTQRIQEKIALLKTKTEDAVHIKFLTSLEGTLKYREAPNDLSNIIWTIFGHLVKEGIHPEHISSLLDTACDILDNAQVIYDLEGMPLVLKITLINKCNGLLGMLGIIDEETEDASLKTKIEEVSERTKSFRDQVSVAGIIKGDFSEVFPILKGQPSLDMGRSELYPQLIQEFYDYYETPDEIEKKALSWLEDELPQLKDTAEKLATIYGIDKNIELVDAEIGKRSSVEKSELLDFIQNFRDNMRELMETSLVRVNPRYDTRVMPTPDYLVNFIPTAAMTDFDSLTDKPFNIFFVTTDENRSPPTSIPDIFQLIIHEEYGHCVNFSNSAVGFAAKPTLIENLTSKLHYPISEGISFHRELESLRLLEDMVGKPKKSLTDAESGLLSSLDKYGDVETLLLETKFVVLKWRIVRFLRAISDVRINMNKQNLVQFVEWAAERTGFTEKTIYDQLFIFQEYPGYAPCYSIAGMALKDIQEEAKKKGKDILEFNTVASSLGFPPRTVWEERLRNL
ncbi:MAG: hypothetical protein JSW28_07450 [Thermoplasmata archaeon]|nr:MAG: hypothetical protein JSW28_07450 [Thermoplasmata archaeon]